MYSNISIASGDSTTSGLNLNVHSLLADSWSSRVAVRVASLDASKYYDPTIPDYPPLLVPFRDDPRYLALDERTKRRILAGAWVAYNEKTIDVEVAVTGPACALLLRDRFHGFDTVSLRRLVAQTQLDEQFHILMCLDACLLARVMHGLEELVIPPSLVSKDLKAAQQRAADPATAELVQMAFAAVAEVTVNAYLDLLANDQDIQPFNRETTACHRKDESFHHHIYKDLTANLHARLSSQEKAVFVQALSWGLEAFVKVDFSAWLEILRFVGVQEAEGIIQQCVEQQGSKRIVRNYSGFRDLLTIMGVREQALPFDFRD